MLPHGLGEGAILLLKQNIELHIHVKKDLRQKCNFYIFSPIAGEQMKM